METDDKQFIDDCFLAGILHDVGKLIFVTNMDEIYLPVLECVRTNGWPIALCENEKLGVGHAEVGPTCLVYGDLKRRSLKVFADTILPNYLGRD